LEEVETDKLEDIGFSNGKKSFSLTRPLLEDKETGFPFAQYVAEILGEQARWFKMKGGWVYPDRMVLYHGLGPKWSSFLGGFLTGALEVTPLDKVRVIATNDFVKVLPLGPVTSQKQVF
jgi:hypothetical protein